MIIGAHSIIYSTNADADRAFLSDVLDLPTADGGGGYLIFGLPPAEVAVHPSGKNDVHEFYLMCDDVEGLIAKISDRGIACGPVEDEGWGLLTRVSLPGGGKLGIYQPRHARPKAMSVGKVGVRRPKRATRQAAKPSRRNAPKKKVRRR
jgi:hypothetical protein